MFCPGSGTKRAQPGSALALPAAFADINTRKKRSVYYWLGLVSGELCLSVEIKTLGGALWKVRLLDPTR
jgi:hypothetical protein